MPQTTEQLRADLDRAMIYAPSKWSSHLTRIVEAYAAAYQTQTKVLEHIEAAKRAQDELATMLLSIVLPSLVGGFVGAIISGNGKQVIDKLTSQAAKYRWGVAVDTLKTVASDLYKQDVRLAYQRLTETSGWKPTAITPTEFMASVNSCVTDFVTIAADLLNDSKKGRIKTPYRDVVAALYASPFVWQAPEAKDWWHVADLTPVMEVFLWVDWANHRQTDYWLKRISNVTDRDTVPSNLPPVRGQMNYNFVRTEFFKDVAELKDLSPILERLDACGVKRAYDTMPIPALGNDRFLNILWLRKLAPLHYSGTLLGELVQKFEGKDSAIPLLWRRPRTFRLM